MAYTGPALLKLRSQGNRLRSKTVELSTDSLPILGIDPGGVTGWSLLILRRKYADTDILEEGNQKLALNTKIKWWHGEIDCRKSNSIGFATLRKVLEDWPSAAIVAESFFIRQRAVDLAPVKFLALLDDYAWQNRRKVFYQQASQAKTTATDDRLRQWNCYTAEGGLGHARDADRHVLLFMRRCFGAQGKWLREQAWPHIYGEER